MSYEHGSASSLNPFQGLGFAASHLPLPSDSLFSSGSDYLGSVVTGNIDTNLDPVVGESWLSGNVDRTYEVEDSSILDGMAPSMSSPDSFFSDIDQIFSPSTQHAFELDGLDRISVAVPFQAQSVFFGLSSESWILPTTLFRMVPL